MILVKLLGFAMLIGTSGRPAEKLCIARKNGQQP